MYVIIALSRLCREERHKGRRVGLMKGKHAQKIFGAVGAMASKPLSLKTRGGGGGLGGVAHKDRAWPPPRATVSLAANASLNRICHGQ